MNSRPGEAPQAPLHHRPPPHRVSSGIKDIQGVFLAKQNEESREKRPHKHRKRHLQRNYNEGERKSEWHKLTRFRRSRERERTDLSVWWCYRVFM